MSPPLRHLARWTWLPTLLLAGWAQAHSPLPPPLVLPGPDGGGMLTVATFSLAPDRAQWPARRDGIVEALRALKPDVIALQDVEQTPDMPNQACWLAARLDYGCNFVSADPPSRPHRYGNALLSRRSVVSDAVTLLHPFEMASTAGMIRLDIDGLPVNVVVTQLHGGGAPGSDDALIRSHQITNLQRWIEVTDDGLPTLLLGDFASDLGARELGALNEGYLDARPETRTREDNAAIVLSNLEPAPMAGAPGHDRILVRRGCFRVAGVAALQLPGDDGPQPRGLVATIQILRPGVAAP